MLVDSGLDVKEYVYITIVLFVKYHFAVPSLFYAVLKIYFLSSPKRFCGLGTHFYIFSYIPIQIFKIIYNGFGKRVLISGS